MSTASKPDELAGLIVSGSNEARAKLYAQGKEAAFKLRGGLGGGIGGPCPGPLESRLMGWASQLSY